MASPQKENGFTAIANEILEILVATPLPEVEHRMLLFIIRKTYGHHKKEDKISYTQFEKALKRSRPVISKALKNLKLRNIIVATPLLALKFNKDWETWIVAPPLLVKNKTRFGSPAPTKTGSPAPTHKRKKEITKEISVGAAKPQVQELFNFFYKHLNPNINFGNKTERSAADWLISHYGYDKVLAAAQYATSVQSDRYAPTITTPYQLKEKMAALVKHKNGKKGKVWKSTSASQPFQREAK